MLNCYAIDCDIHLAPRVGPTIIAQKLRIVTVTAAHRFEVGGYKRWTNDGQLMDNPWINASSREFTVSSIGCAYRAELILGR